MTNTQFSSRDVPWMKLGTVIDGAVTAEEAIQKAGLDWDVEVRKDGFQTAKGTFRIDPSKRKIVRADTEDPLGTVSPGYEVLQYREAFDFLDEIHPEFVAAGSLNDGKQCFLVVRAPDHTELDTLDGEDPHDLYVVLRASHDGSRAVEVNVLPLRGRCMNMMPIAGFGHMAKQKWSFRHTRNLRKKLEQARATLTGINQYTRQYNETAKRLAAVDLELDQARTIVETVVPDYLKKKEQQVDAILGLYQNSSTNGYTGTGWGLVNAVNEHHEYYRGGDNRKPETRWVQGLDGATSKATNAAVRAVMERSR